jgi:hypothetical protein
MIRFDLEITYGSRVVGNPAQSNTTTGRDGDCVASHRIRLILLHWGVDGGVIRGDVEGLVHDLELVSARSVATSDRYDSTHRCRWNGWNPLRCQ